MRPAADPHAVPASCDEPALPESLLPAAIDRYESGLLSHLGLVKRLQTGDGAVAHQTVSQVLESAQRLLDQFSVLRNKLVSLASSDEPAIKNGENSQSERNIHRATGASRISKMTGNGSKSQVPHSHEPCISPTLKPRYALKRTWVQDTDSGIEDRSDRNDDVSQKRPRTKLKLPGASNDVNDFVPVALQKDDISEEVEQRLRLREERREKRNTVSTNKRKRDSTTAKDDIALVKAEQLIGKRHKAEPFE
ncbi:hypothetical protein BGW36DRAFT_428710 [Talaromyces proteolyticus]|uniref:Uncharacterized protein n=1 Tax=Talaromyces proteolyticus TaxID=1131652 RepID=A0AAD4KNH7_9EURO|nr:uncharacterized protein BGW36DRAFT_428710 [Talaromyces proteolyticus]KAH8696717.1 hypothetical protein BGW36DRAFT_428710 [Talaromyces proteolyticus]